MAASWQTLSFRTPMGTATVALDDTRGLGANDVEKLIADSADSQALLAKLGHMGVNVEYSKHG